MKKPILRFAPSPNGPLHLGHAYCALFGAEKAEELGGQYLLRMEDIDVLRCKPEFLAEAHEILSWLGIRFDGPIRRQSEHMQDYSRALSSLKNQGLLYPCWCSRKELHAELRDPDGAPLHQGRCQPKQGAYALRLDMQKAKRSVRFREQGQWVEADPNIWGDVIIARKDIGTSYHLAVVVDDALQGVSHVTRGQDLFAATSVQRLLQYWLELPEPCYHHHELIRDDGGRKLSKSEGDRSIAALREEGVSPADIREAFGFHNKK